MNNRKLLPSILIVLIVIALAVLYYILYYSSDNDKDAAIQALAAQNIDPTTDNFFSEIRAAHKDNVRLLIIAGADASLADKDNISALSAAAEGGDADIFAMVLATLPADPAQAQAIVNQPDNKGGTALFAAVEKDSLSEVNQLLEHGGDTGHVNQEHETPLILAIKQKHGELIKPLMDADARRHNYASINIADSSSKSPLAYAIEQQNEPLVKMLLTAKADALTPDFAGATPLMDATQTGNLPIVKLLMQAGDKLDIADKAGNTPLILAIRYNYPDLVKFFVENGADVDFHTTGPLPLQTAIDMKPFNPDLITYLLTRSKQTATIAPSLLFAALDYKSMDIVKALLNAGVDPKITDAKGVTALYHAIESGNEDIAVMLIDKGADIYQTGVPGITPLSRAVANNESKVVEKLLSMGVSPIQKTADGYTLAEIAVYRGYPEVLEALLAKNAVIEKDFGLLWAIRDGHGKAVAVLLAHGANPNVMTENGDPALWLAASMNETEAVVALAQHHAAINYPNKAQGMTALAIASHAGQLASVKLLIEAGAKLEIKDHYGMTALAHAAFMSHPDVVEYLMSKGADINAKDNQGRSVTDLAGLGAASEARDKVMNLLLQKR